MKLIFFVLIITLVINQIICSQKVRGVVPERASLYDVSKPFTCLDGSSVIPFEQVNDDYCDCRDGSDEPGTSACMNSSFACENLGYIVQMVPSSRVNDGICDCCDGSDEYDSNTSCENKCVALAAKMREEEEKMKILTDQGKAKRKELADQGNELKKALEEKLKELEASKSNAETEKNRLEELKNAAEAKTKEAKEKQDKILEEKAKLLEKLENLRLAKVMFTEIDANKDNFCTPDELLKYPELDILFDNDGQFTLEESTRLLDQNEKIDLETFSNVYFEKILPHINNKTVDVTESTDLPTVPTLPTETSTDEPHEDSNSDSNEPHDENQENLDSDNHEYQDEQNTNDDHPEKTSDNSKYDTETQNLIEESDKAQRAYQDAANALSNIENELKDTKQKLELDTGSNAEFASMINKCFEYEDREYVYKLCPFDKTVQKSKSNSAETAIGHWSSWGSDGNKYLAMKFNNGLACWNGPQRSTLVRLTCGIESKLVAVSEPNRCEYEMKFETPAVCEDMKANQTGDSHEEL